MTSHLQFLTPDLMRTARRRVTIAQGLSIALVVAILLAFPATLIYWKGVHPAFYALVAAFVASLFARAFLRRAELEKLERYADQHRQLLCLRCYELHITTRDGRARCDLCGTTWRSDALLEFLHNPRTTSPPQTIGRSG